MKQRPKWYVTELGPARWLARVTIGVQGGKRVQKAKVFSSRKEADAWALQMAGQREAGTLVLPTTQTVAQYLEGWLQHLPGVRPVTQASYRDTVRKHLVPELGAYRLADLSPAAIRAYIVTKEKQDLSPTTIRYHLLVLRMALKVALTDGLIRSNPAVAVKPPKKRRPDIHPLDEEEARLFMGAARRWATMPPKRTSKHAARSLSKAQAAHRQTVADLFTVALDTWMRQGELLGVRVGDVDLTRRRVTVRKALARMGGLMDPKTESSRRIIDLVSEEAVEALRRQCAGKEPDALVFADVDARNLLRDLDKVLRLARLKHVRFHDIRHTGASIALVKGVPVKDVSARLGHSSAKMTLDTYAHLLTGTDQRIADAMQGVLGKVTPVQRKAALDRLDPVEVA